MKPKLSPTEWLSSQPKPPTCHPSTHHGTAVALHQRKGGGPKEGAQLAAGGGDAVAGGAHAGGEDLGGEDVGGEVRPSVEDEEPQQPVTGLIGLIGEGHRSDR